jgi:hypothetical protein
MHPRAIVLLACRPLRASGSVAACPAREAQFPVVSAKARTRRTLIHVEHLGCMHVLTCFAARTSLQDKLTEAACSHVGKEHQGVCMDLCWGLYSACALPQHISASCHHNKQDLQRDSTTAALRARTAAICRVRRAAGSTRHCFRSMTDVRASARTCISGCSDVTRRHLELFYVICRARQKYALS